jgi:hypothetical protein
MNNEDRKLDWKPRFDPASKHYGIRALLKNKIIIKKRVMWKEGVVTDQGSEGACVGFAWMNELLATPVPPKEQPSSDLANSLAVKYYREAKKIDEWPGEDYEGTSVLAGAKIIQSNGFIEQYRWCFSIKDVRDAVIAEGPVVIGVPWLSGMYETGPEGVVKVVGDHVGGHAITITGYDPSMQINGKAEEVFRWRNSWGNEYGIDGSGYIKYNDLQYLLSQSAEACVPVGRKVPIFEKEIEAQNSVESSKSFFVLLRSLFCK